MDTKRWSIRAQRVMATLVWATTLFSDGEVVEAQWQGEPCRCNACVTQGRPTNIQVPIGGHDVGGPEGYAAMSFPALSTFGPIGPSSQSHLHAVPTFDCSQASPVVTQFGHALSTTSIFSPGLAGSSVNSCTSCEPMLGGPICRSCGPIGIYGGFEFLWMRAHFDQNVAMIIDPPMGNTLKPFDYGFELAPRTWLGWQSCKGGGLRATYWQFDASAATARATAVPGATPVYLFVYGAGGNLSRNAYADLNETLVSNHNLRLRALDLEATQNFSCFSLQCLVGVGLRLADMEQHLRGDVYDATNALWEVVTNDLTFQGVGPTLSMQVLRPISCSQFSIFSGLRGAFLLSDTRQAIYEMKDGFANELTDVAQQTEVLSMGEFALGIQYAQCIGQRAQFFVRGSFECQAWFDVGGPVDSHSTVALDAVGLTTGLWF